MTKKMYDSEISLKQIYNKSKIRKQKISFIVLFLKTAELFNVQIIKYK